MSFTSPWLLWTLFAASIPIIIHLVNRWRHRSVHWAAMEFLLRAARETRGTKKLLHYLILALRVLARGGSCDGVCSSPPRQLLWLGEFRTE